MLAADEVGASAVVSQSEKAILARVASRDEVERSVVEFYLVGVGRQHEVQRGRRFLVQRHGHAVVEHDAVGGEFAADRGRGVAGELGAEGVVGVGALGQFGLKLGAGRGFGHGLSWGLSKERGFYGSDRALRISRERGWCARLPRPTHRRRPSRAARRRVRRSRQRPLSVAPGEARTATPRGRER